MFLVPAFAWHLMLTKCVQRVIYSKQRMNDHTATKYSSTNDWHEDPILPKTIIEAATQTAGGHKIKRTNKFELRSSV